MIVMRPGFGNTISTTMNIGASYVEPSKSLLKMYSATRQYEWVPAFDRYDAGRRATSCSLQPSSGSQIQGRGGLWAYGGCTMSSGVAWNQAYGLGDAATQEFGPGALPLLKRPTTVTPVVTATPTVTDPCAPCASSALNMTGSFPKCTSAADKAMYIALCCAMAKGDSAAYDRWLKYASTCGTAAPPPPPPRQAPPPPPPADVTPPLDLPEPPSGDGGGDTNSDPVPQSQGVAKMWGPIIGIGLIVAVALTLARKKRGKKSRRKR